MLMVNKTDLDPKMNIMGLKRGDRVEIEIADVTPMGLTLDPKTLKLDMPRDPMEQREPLVKAKKKNMADMPLPALKNMIQTPPAGPAPMAPPPAAMPPMAPPVH